MPQLHRTGSGNVGASNVWRVGGALPALLTLVGDTAKGMAALWVAAYLEPSSPSLTVGGVAVLLGHIHPALFGFNGGKGVATAFGILLVISWPLALILLVFWGVIFAFSRTPSVASLITTTLAPLLYGYFGGSALALRIGLLSLLVVVSHRKNIMRIVKGDELTL
jgi:glycerol-3-phosphate acyltransferase PlsY